MMNIFDIICKKCGGKCCKSTILLTQKDIDKLQAYKGRFSTEVPPGFMVLVDGKCPFLSDSGCVLSRYVRPFDCLFFPLAFTYKDGRINVFLNKKCPYYAEIPKDWIEETKKWALEELKVWSEKEKIAYSRMVEKYPSSQLIPV